jgi:hypothetical protein
LGTGTAHPAGDTTIDLHIGDDNTFTWKGTAKGKPRQLTEKWSAANDLLTPAQERETGVLVGRLTWRRRQVEISRRWDMAGGSRVTLHPLNAA